MKNLKDMSSEELASVGLTKIHEGDAFNKWASEVYPDGVPVEALNGWQAAFVAMEEKRIKGQFKQMFDEWMNGSKAS